MTEKQAIKQEGGTVYSLRGSLLEVCSCGVMCPCWIGEDPDGGECYAIISYHFDTGEIDALDVSGLTLVIVAHIPGNILAGNWEVVVLVDDRATEEQRDAVLAAFTGQLGGPLTDVYQLIGQVKGVESVPIRHTVVDGAGMLEIPGVLDADMEPYRGPDGSVTTVQNSIFSTVPGSPAWIAKASRNRVSLSKYGMSWEYEGRNAIQGDWSIEYAA